MSWVAKPRPGRFTPGKRDAVPTTQEAEWDSGPVWTGGENLAPTEQKAGRWKIFL